MKRDDLLLKKKHSTPSVALHHIGNPIISYSHLRDRENLKSSKIEVTNGICQKIQVSTSIPEIKTH